MYLKYHFYAAIFSFITLHASTANRIEGSTNPFKQAIFNKNIPAIKKLIESKHDLLFQKDIYDVTPLMIAAYKGTPEIVTLLINAGSDVNAIDGRDQPHAGYSVLRFALDGENIDIIKLLIAKAADVNFMTEGPFNLNKGANMRNASLLSYALYSKKPFQIIKTLIDAGANVNQDEGKWLGIKNFWTPLMIAAFVGNTEGVKALLKAGANLKAQNSRDNNKTALDYAQEQGHTEIIKLLAP